MGQKLVKIINAINNGDVVLVRFEYLSFQCRIIDTKTAYGNIHCLIIPAHQINNEPSQWVNSDRIKF
jgi:hypothetical protein